MSNDVATNAYEEVLGNMRKAAEANLKMQQDLFQQWTRLWPGIPNPQSMWIDKMRDFQRQWSNTVSDLAHKHRDVVNRQYQSALESLEEALRLTEASNPEEFRRRSELLCRKTLETMREISETQIKEFQDAMLKWSELVTKTGS